jgi:hypothetical protein
VRSANVRPAAYTSLRSWTPIGVVAQLQSPPGPCSYMFTIKGLRAPAVTVAVWLCRQLTKRLSSRKHLLDGAAAVQKRLFGKKDAFLPPPYEKFARYGVVHGVHSWHELQ